MILLVAGTRTIDDIDLVSSVLEESPFGLPDLIIQGGARGVDACAKQWADIHEIPCATFEAYWDKYGPSAGPKRNAQMARVAENCVLIWDGRSPGSASMKRLWLLAHPAKTLYQKIVAGEGLKRAK